MGTSRHDRKQISSKRLRLLIMVLLLCLLQSAHTTASHSAYNFDGEYICATGDFPSYFDLIQTRRSVNGSNQDLITVAFMNSIQYRLYQVNAYRLIDGADCKGELILGDGITEIADDAFYVRTNGEDSWQSNSRSVWFMGEVSQLTDITIPSSVTTIGNNAFRNSLLSTINFLGNAPTVGIDAFLNIPNGLTVYVSANATGFNSGIWENFNIVRPPVFSISSNSETKSVNSAITGYTISSTGGTITSYAITPSAPAGLTFNTATGLLSGTPTGVAGATAFTITGTNGAGSTTATFTLTVTATNNSNSSGSGATTTSTTAADELRRQQETAAAAKQKQDQELREILSLVPTIAGLAQGIAGLGNSLLLPQKCVKGKTVKKVKAGAKCPEGYKVRK